MSATNQNQEKADSLTIKQNEDGSYTIDWDPQDPNWKFMNNFTSAEIQCIIQQAVQEELKDR
jgi:hypothetical protein